MNNNITVEINHYLPSGKVAFSLEEVKTRETPCTWDAQLAIEDILKVLPYPCRFSQVARIQLADDLVKNPDLFLGAGYKMYIFISPAYNETQSRVAGFIRLRLDTCSGNYAIPATTYKHELEEC